MMKSLRGILALVAVAVLLVQPAWADVIHVDLEATGAPADGTTWDQAYRAIQPALDASSAGDELWVASSAYEECVTLKSGVSAYGGFAGGESTRDARDPLANTTTIDASNEPAPNHAVVGADGAVLDGFVITGGNADSFDGGENPGLGTGGGVFAHNVSITLVNCVIAGNAAAQLGGGVYLNGSDSTLLDCEICDNATDTGGVGGGLAAVTSDFTMTRCRVLGNTASSLGGGIYVSRCAATATQSLILANEAALGGGAALSTDASLSVTNCVLGDNLAALDGGGVYCSSNSYLSLLNCTVSGNSAASNGGGIANEHSSLAVLVNAIVWGNTPDAVYNYEGCLSTASSCIIEGGHSGSDILDADPRVRLVREPFPYTLSWDSPALDAATETAPEEDVMGNPRPMNNGPDIGAYEFGTDSDGAGLPDDYETANGLEPSDGADDAADSDADGLDNREEFRRGTNPQDNNDPPSQFYVATTGSDETGDGSEGNPWRTIGFAIASVPEGTAAFPITIHVDTGTYDERVVFRPHVRVVGAGAGLTTIQHYNAADDEHVVMTAAEDTALEACTLTFPLAVTATAELVRIPDVNLQMKDVDLDAKDSPHAIGVFVTGPGSSASRISYCRFRRGEYGVFAVNSGVNITRNLFEDMFEGAIFIRPPEKQNGETDETPLLGDVEDIAVTGFNRFRMTTGFFVKNMSPETTMAEYNDWGVYTETEIEARLTDSVGEVDYQPFIGKMMIPGAIVVEMLDADTLEHIAPAHNPYILLRYGATSVDAEGSFVLFDDLEPGTYNCEATADTYVEESSLIVLTGSEVAARTLKMAKEGEGEGEGPTPPPGCMATSASKGGPSGQFGGLNGDVLALCFTLLLLGIAVRGLVWKRDSS